MRPGSDAALALGMMHVIVTEGRWDRGCVERHTVGFDALAAHVRDYPPARAAAATGVPAEQIVALARRYATTTPAMIVVGGRSMHKSDGAWTGARAIGCLPGLTGNVGIPGGASARATAAPPTARRSAPSAPRTGARPATGFRARCPSSPRRCSPAACA